MRRGVLQTAMLILGATGTTLVGGCGSQTKTVSVSGAPPSSSQTISATTTLSSQSTTTAATSTTSTTATRSAPEPAFTRQGTANQGLKAAEATLRAHGYTAADSSDYRPRQTLRVLLGTRTGSGDGYGQQAFFFVNGTYIGTDVSQASAKVRVIAQNDTQVTLAYPLYRPKDALCCPGGGEAHVRFQLDNGKLTPLDEIPPAHSKTQNSRQ